MGPPHEESGGEPTADGPSGAALLAALPRAAFLLATDGSVRRWNEAAAALVPGDGLATFDLLARQTHRERAREAVETAAERGAATVSFDLDSTTGGTATFDCTAVQEEGHTVAVLAVRRPVGVADATDRGNTELAFSVTGENCFLAQLSAATGPVVLRWTVPEEGGLRHFLEVEGPATAVEAAAEAAGADDVAVVSERGDTEDGPITVLEGRPGSSVAAWLGDAGAVVQAGTAEDGVAEFTARLPGWANTRTVVETLQEKFEATLSAKRRVDEPVETALDLRQAAEERLTDRQSDVLRTAHLMGYYEWPRDHTAEEVADRIGITSATLHYHLRGAQRNFLELLFDESPAGG